MAVKKSRKHFVFVICFIHNYIKDGVFTAVVRDVNF